jgi:HD-GYP domain-containing protein (c-di-GMP phosphodiesterase class II)
MRERAELNRWTANVAVMGVGLASAFIPVAGIWISGSIFTGIALDRIETEYRRDGKVSAEAWMMLGLTVATMGFGGAALRTARLARTAKATGQLAGAERLAALSTRFTYANIGIGSFMLGYMGAATWHIYTEYQAGRAHLRDVILSASMTLFPVVHMSVSGIRAYQARMAASRAGQTLPIDPTIGPEPGPGKALRPTQLPAPELTTPEGVFAFLQMLTGADSGARAVANARLARMPTSVRTTIEGWVGRSGVVRSALESGTSNDLALQQIRGGIKNFRPHLETGISGTPAQNDIIRLTDHSNLANLLRRLLTPDSAVQGRSARARRALAARDAARFTLERIRSENPEAARYVDMILNNEGYSALRAELTSGRPLSPTNTRTLRNSSVQIGETLPENMRPWAMSMAANEGTPTSEVIGGRRESVPPGTQTLEPRASAQGDGKGPPPGGVRPPLQERGQPAGGTHEGSLSSSRGARRGAAQRTSVPLAEAGNMARLRGTVRRLKLDPAAEEAAIRNIDDATWLEPANTVRARMNQNRAATRAQMEQYFQSAARELGWSDDAIKQYSDSFLSLLDVSERNGYTTYGHTLRVARYTEGMLTQMAQHGINLSRQEMAEIRLAALIHDVGKIAVPNKLWRFEGKPSAEQTALMETHAQQSTKIADGLFENIGLVDKAQFRRISEMAGYHQEFFDGTRYGGLKGEQIPLGSRVISLADSYDAMRSMRSYRDSLPLDVATGQIQKFSGTQFDPALAPIFIEAVQSR